MSNKVARVDQKSLVQKLGEKFTITSDDLDATLQATAFKLPKKDGKDQKITPQQMIALLVVADQYGLNPFTREIYAFPDKGGGVVPVIGVDGWSRIINEHPQFDGLDFALDEEGCTCKIYRKDRKHAVSVTEYFSECKRNTIPWGTHPKRMIRHKALVQCARLAFGLVGVFDPDEAERIAEKDITAEVVVEPPIELDVKELPAGTIPVEVPVRVDPTSLEGRIAACSTLEEVLSLESEVDAIEDKDEHTKLMAAGKLRYKELKAAATK
jgi:phage recombination protein Bet